MYKDVVDTTTLTKRDKMNKLFVVRKTNWTPLMLDSSSSNLNFSSLDSPFIDFS